QGMGDKRSAGGGLGWGTSVAQGAGWDGVSGADSSHTMWSGLSHHAGAGLPSPVATGEGEGVRAFLPHPKDGGQGTDVGESQTQNLKPNTQNFDELIAGEMFYERMQAHGLQYGPAFQGLEQIWRRDGEALGRLRLP